MANMHEYMVLFIYSIICIDLVQSIRAKAFIFCSKLLNYPLGFILANVLFIYSFCFLLFEGIVAAYVFGLLIHNWYYPYSLGTSWFRELHEVRSMNQADQNREINKKIIF